MNEDDKLVRGEKDRVDLRKIDMTRPHTVAAFGAEMIEVRPERAVLRYTFRPEWCDSQGCVQGGVLCIFLDDAIGYAVIGYQGWGKLQPFTSTDLSTHFLRPITGGSFDAVAQVVRMGAKALFVEANIVQNEKMMAKASSALIFI